jgi:hypothetical protein
LLNAEGADFRARLEADYQDALVARKNQTVKMPYSLIVLLFTGVGAAFPVVLSALSVAAT